MRKDSELTGWGVLLFSSTIAALFSTQAHTKGLINIKKKPL